MSKFVYKGAEYKSKKDCCLSLGLNFKTVAAYSRSHDVSFESALNLYTNPEVERRSDGSILSRNIYVYRGVEYNSKMDCCLAFGLKSKLVSSYACSHGISFETALDKYVDGEIVQSQAGYTYRGVEYESKKDCCLAFGLNYNTMCGYASNHGIDFETSLDMHIDGKVVGRDVEINGVVYSSIRNCCKDLGIDVSGMYVFKASNNIDSIEDAIIEYNNYVKSTFIYDNAKGKAVRDKSTYNYAKKQVVVDGITYDSIASCLKALDLTIGGVRHFKDRNNINSTEDAIVQYYHYIHSDSSKFKPKREKICIDNIEYDSIKECCKELGICYGHLFSFKRKNGLKNIEDAVLLLLKQRDNFFEYAGEKYTSLSACCKSLGIAPETVLKYKDLYGTSVENAITLYLESRKNKFQYRGRAYESITQCCGCFNLSYPTVSRFSVRNKVTVIDSLDYYILMSKFIFDKIDFIKNDLFSCRCNLCGGRFLFTRDLAFKHIEECYGK